ncbi:MAG: beta-phosphoglucomutase, partial [Duncaniella sp.]|nr:beta-phosphoglucomutase [Duncaniella sp.]
SESIVLENAPLGVEAGRRSGAFTIAVTTGPVPAGEMWEAGADIVFPSMPDLAANITLLLTTILQTKL